MKALTACAGIFGFTVFVVWLLHPEVFPEQPSPIANIQTTAVKWIPAPHESDCLQVQMRRADDRLYWVNAYNQCNFKLRQVYILVKFLDPKGRRIGVSRWEAHYVAPHEQIHRRMSTPGNVAGYATVETRLITTDPTEASK
ncbi:MAG: hypothetical protein ABI995_02730 [Acidobacteriota bacterium]